MYARSIMLGRDQMQIVAAPQVQQLINQYQQQLEQQAQAQQSRYDQLQAQQQQQLKPLLDQIRALKQQLFDEQDQVQQQQQALTQLAASNQALLIDNEVNKFKYEMASSQLAEEQTKASQAEERWQEERQQLKVQLKESQRGQQHLQETSRVIDSVTNFFAKNPRVGDGLGSLLSAKPREQPKAAPSKEAQLGAAMYHDFPGAKLRLMLDVLQFLHETPSEKAALLAHPAFKNYQAKLLASRQQASDPGKKAN